MSRLAVCALALCLVVGCFSRPQESKDKTKPLENPTAASPSGRTSRLQKPTQVLNPGFDEIVVESNLQVHNRVGSKNKSKIMLPSNTTTSSTTNKSARSLVV